MLCQPVVAVVVAVAPWWASSSSSLTEPWFLSGTELSRNPLVVALGWPLSLHPRLSASLPSLHSSYLWGQARGWMS